jgi:hypothetical protein
LQNLPHTGPSKAKEKTIKILRQARHQWLMPEILATQEAEIRRVTVLSQLGQIVCQTLSQKGLARVAQHEGPKFKHQYHQKKKKKKKIMSLKKVPTLPRITFLLRTVFTFAPIFA